jgi:sporulation integral membrane protein YtvI
MKEKISGFANASIGLLSFLILLFIFAEYILPVILPFLIAWLISAITSKPARNLSKRIKVPEKIIRLMMSIFLTLSVAGGLGLILWSIVDAVWRFLSDLGEGNRLYDLLTAIFSAEIPFLKDTIPDELSAGVKGALKTALGEIFSAMASGATLVAGALPQAFFVLLITIISLVYFSLDYDRVNGFVKSILPDRITVMIADLKNGVIKVIKKYLISYSLILFMTFVIMLTGFLILRIEHALLLSIIVAFLDILPIIGVGTVIIPWAIVEFAIGDGSLAVGLLVLFVVNAIIRQLAEPKIIGKNLDLHPIATLILLYVGYSLFGFVGLIVLPVIVLSIGVVLKGDNATEIA